MANTSEGANKQMVTFSSACHKKDRKKGQPNKIQIDCLRLQMRIPPTKAQVQTWMMMPKRRARKTQKEIPMQRSD